MRRVVWLLSLVLLAAPAAAQTGTPQPEDPAPQAADLEEVAHEVTGPPLGESLLNGLGDAGAGIVDAAQSAGSGLADAVAAVGAALLASVRWSGAAVAATAGALGTLGAAVSLALAGGTAAAAKGLLSGLGSLGAAAALVVVAAGASARDLIVAVAGAVSTAVAWVASTYYGAISALRPHAMPEPAFAAAAAGGAAATAGAAAYASWDAVRRWMWSLFGIAGFSRISEDQILQHPLRRRVFEAIQQQPGIHASALAREVGAGWGTIVHHLQKLERARLVTTRSVNNQKCFFEQGGDISRRDMAVASAVKNDTAARIAAFVQHHPLSSQKDVAAHVGISAALASFHVKKLVAQGALERVRSGKSWLLAATDSFRRVSDGAPMSTTSVPAAARVSL